MLAHVDAIPAVPEQLHRERQERSRRFHFVHVEPAGRRTDGQKKITNFNGRHDGTTKGNENKRNIVLTTNRCI